MEFVDRINEQERLLKILSRKDPGFAIIRGQRRIGKSTLVQRVLSDTDIYFEADRTDAVTQLPATQSMESRILKPKDGGDGF